MKKILLFVVIALTLLSIPATVFLVSQQQEIRKRAAPATTLSLVPATKTMEVGETITLEAVIDTGANQIAAVEIQVVFDPTKLEAVSITNGAFAPNILRAGRTESGQATITVGAPHAAKPISGQGTVATIRLKALAPTSPTVSVRFGTDTSGTAFKEKKKHNAIVGTTPATITIGGGGAIVPTPTVQVTPTLTLTPTPTSTQSGTATSSGVVILTPSENENVETQPLLTGTSAPGATVTLTIYSTPQTAVVTADANGNWSYQLPDALEAGPHNLVVTVQDAQTGTTSTASVAFVVSGDSASASSEPVPVSGSFETTLILVGIGFFMLISGLALPAILR